MSRLTSVAERLARRVASLLRRAPLGVVSLLHQWMAFTHVADRRWQLRRLQHAGAVSEYRSVQDEIRTELAVRAWVSGVTALVFGIPVLLGVLWWGWWFAGPALAVLVLGCGRRGERLVEHRALRADAATVRERVTAKPAVAAPSAPAIEAGADDEIVDAEVVEAPVLQLVRSDPVAELRTLSDLYGCFGSQDAMWSSTVVECMRAARPGAYEHLTTRTMRALVEPLGVPVVMVMRAGEQRKGIRRDDVFRELERRQRRTGAM